MARSKIEWLARPGTLPESWSPCTGCDPDDGFQSEACIHCYARRMSKRLAGRAGYPRDEPFRVTWHKDRLFDPLRWRKPRTVFVCSMGDLFHRDVPTWAISQVFEIIGQANKEHTFIVLTKRPMRMYLFMQRWERCEGVPFDLPNVWLGVTAENQQRANERIPTLLEIPAAVHFVSVEPMLGDMSLSPWLYPNEWVTVGTGPNVVGAEIETGLPQLSWIVAGGETGPGARPMQLEWIRRLRDQCVVADTPFFLKSWGEYAPVWNSKTNETGYTMMHVGRQEAGHLLDGKEWRQWPES